jgi:hypothetical protein
MNSKKIAVVAVMCAVVALAACRREAACCAPMKLGADVSTADLAK